MFLSVDTIGLVQNCNLPPEKILESLGAYPVWTKYGKKWIYIGRKGKNKPRITIYPTWQRSYLIRADIELSKMLYGHNIRLVNKDEIADTLNLISKYVEEQTTIPFDAFNSMIYRIDYAANKYFDSKRIVRKFIKRYFGYKIPRLTRHIIESETIYFENKSRIISIYDKFTQMAKKKDVSPNVLSEAEKLVRLEYRLKNNNSVKRFAERLGFENTLAKTMLSQQSIKIATNEMFNLLNIGSFDYSNKSPIEIAFDQTKDIKRTIQQVGFREAIKKFGEHFYLLDGMNMSKSTYDRLVRESQKSGF